MATYLSIPVDATFLPKPVAFIGELQHEIEADKTEVAHENANARNSFDLACTNWAGANTQRRAYGLAMTPKPIAPAEIVVKTAEVAQQGSPSEGDKVMQVLAADDQNPLTGVYVWQEVGSPLGLCPDLPTPVIAAKPIPEPPHVIGVPADDPVPVGTKITDPNGHTWQKQRATTPFATVAWWEMVA